MNSLISIKVIFCTLYVNPEVSLKAQRTYYVENLTLWRFLQCWGRWKERKEGDKGWLIYNGFTAGRPGGLDSGQIIMENIYVITKG